ncbi:MAG: hypothetical protein BWY23_02133 [Spirochaetes bacterium ADurb.Bin218]|jgi:hypothetical protein|nr:hypothetical protein [Spirochaetota bacterium]OQA96204.1 MAG: hypothetical protein BWY23_02133 [Spirochaetes bacterium ADurb.Bin218]
MKLKKIKRTIAFAAIIFFYNQYKSHGAEYFTKATILAGTGPSFVSGFYEDYFKTGWKSHFGILYNPDFSKYFFIQPSFAYSSYEMDASSQSILREWDFSIAGLLGYYILPFSIVTAGLSFHESYDILTTYNTNRKETAFKPAVSAQVSALVYLGRGIGLFTQCDLKRREISEKKFDTISITFGATYNYYDYMEDIETRSNSEKKIELFGKAQEELKAKNFENAKKLFLELQGIDSDYPGLDYQLKRITEIEEYYNLAKKHLSSKSYSKSIRNLEYCAPYIKECETQLLSLRQSLRIYISQWEKQGIALYEKQQYQGCIELMEQILAVDPGNKIANIYLPRAIKRKKAIESLSGFTNDN